MGQDSLGVLAAHSQQLVQREGGGAEDGLEAMVSMPSARS